MRTGKNTLIIDNTVTCGFSFFHQGEGLRICYWNNLIIQKTTPKNHLFKKRKKFSLTYTLEFWAEILAQYSQLKVEEHNGTSEFRSDAWFVRKWLVNTLKKDGKKTHLYNVGSSSTCFSWHPASQKWGRTSQLLGRLFGQPFHFLVESIPTASLWT